MRVEGQEFFVSNHCHVRGDQGKDDEFTCEVVHFSEDSNDEKVARIRWFYWPAELQKRPRKLKNLPSFSPKEVILSDEYSLIDVQTLSKKCHITLLQCTAQVPVKSAKGTLYCKWKITEGSKELSPAVPNTPQPMKSHKQRGPKKKTECTTISKKRKTSPKVTDKSKRKQHTSSPPTKKQRTHLAQKEDKNLFQMARERYEMNSWDYQEFIIYLYQKS